MKKLTLLSLLYIVLLGGTSCIKDEGCQNKTVQSETAAIAALAATNGMTGTTHASGVYYQVTVPGTGITPSPTSTVSVKYTGKLANGTVFDSQTTTAVNFVLGGTIQGFQIGLQLVSKGGTIKFIIPSSLAYGCDGNSNIPGNSLLYFEVQLIDVL